MNKQDIIDFENHYESQRKCRCGVAWKPSVKQYTLNGLEESLKMEDKLKTGKWKNGRPKPITITYPKKRDSLSIPFRDRVYQRNINDNALYPMMTRSFIYDNAACQKGKGPDFARERMKKFLRRYYHSHGSEGYILQIDIKGYYPNMNHDAVNKKFAKHLPEDIWQMATDVLNTQYRGEVGYNPGSQMVQIAGISLLDGPDHFIKEKLREKYYIRYMDDMAILNSSQERLKEDLKAIQEELAKLGFMTHPAKTRIIPLSKGFLFLGFNYRITSTGKVIMTLNGQNIKHERRKLKKMVGRARRGLMTREKVDNCFESWKTHASKGNSYKLLQRMDDYYNTLWRVENAKDN